MSAATGTMGGAVLDAAALETVLAALDDAATLREPFGGYCSSCGDDGDGECLDHAGDAEAAARYRRLARDLEEVAP